VQYYEALGDLTALGDCYNTLGRACFSLGNWPDAIGYWERSRDLATRAEVHENLETACLHLGSLYNETGRFEQATAVLEQCLELARDRGNRAVVAEATGHLGEIKARQGQGLEARALYEQAITAAKAQRVNAVLAENLRRSAELALLEARIEDAEAYLAEGLEVARAHDLTLLEGTLLSVKGLVAAECGRMEEAVTSFQEGAVLLERLRFDYPWARLKFHQGRAYHKLGFYSEADSALRQAEDIFRRVGAAWALRRAHEALLRLDSEDDKGRLRLQKLQVLLDVAQSLGTETELETLLRRILDRAIELTQTERGFILLLDEQGEPATYLTRGIARDELENPGTSQFSTTVLQKVLKTRDALAITDIDQVLELKVQASIVSLGLRAIMCAPLLRGEKLQGVIYVDSSKVTEGFYQADVSVLEAVAHAAAISLENAQLVAALQQKTELMSILAHEFRTPLTASTSFIRLLLNGEEPLTEDQRDGLEGVLQQSERLAAMIGDVLELAGMEARRVQWAMAPLEMNTLIEQTRDQLATLARQKRIEVVIERGPEDVQVYGNRGRLIQVVTNLLSNAFKFTPEGGRVTVSCSVIERPRPAGASVQAEEFWSLDGPRLSDLRYWVTRVTDTGSGIQEEDVGLIFERFAQSGDERSRKKGTGLGLAIAREIVEQHHGQIWADNVAAEGARFSFTLPLVEENSLQ